MGKKKEEDVEPVFEDESDAEIEYVNEEDVPAESEEPEDLKKETKQSLYDKVKALEAKESSRGDPSERITTAFETAVNKMKAPEAPPLVPQAGESEKDFRERLKKDLFDEDKAEGVLNELIDRRLGPRLAQTVEINFSQAEKIMELDPVTGPVFKKYKGEIRDYIKTNFAQFQKDPRALELAFNQIRVIHIDDIAQDRANAILEQERKKAPERRERIPLETGGGSVGGGGGGESRPRKITVAITQEDRRIADESGVDAEVVAARRARQRS